MVIKIVRRNKRLGTKRVWQFLARNDTANFFNIKEANNVFMFCRFTEYDKDENLLKSFDTDGTCTKNCTWREAKPSDEIVQKAWSKYIDSFKICVPKNGIRKKEDW